MGQREGRSLSQHLSPGMGKFVELSEVKVRLFWEGGSCRYCEGEASGDLGALSREEKKEDRGHGGYKVRWRRRSEDKVRDLVADRMRKQEEGREPVSPSQGRGGGEGEGMERKGR